MTAKTHAHGSPCWFELASDNLEATRRFYTALFGWETVERPMNDGSVYTVFRLQDRDVAAAYPLTEGDIAGGRPPPHWDVYFRVDDVDAAVASVRQHGGKVLVEPFELECILRMAVVADAEGAVFCLGQLRQLKGVGAVRENNAVAWVELATRDLGRAEALYRDLLGWQTSEHSAAPSQYKVGSTADGPVGGLMQMTPEWGDLPSHWALYFQVADVDASVARAESLGGKVCVPAFDVPGVGRIAMLVDPSGANFYLITFAAS